MTVYLQVCHTAQEPSGSLFWCHTVMSLQVTHIRPSPVAELGRLQSLWADCSIVSPYCVTITWQQIFKVHFKLRQQAFSHTWR